MQLVIKLIRRIIAISSVVFLISCTTTPTLFMAGDSTMANKPLEGNPE